MSERADTTEPWCMPLDEPAPWARAAVGLGEDARSGRIGPGEFLWWMRWLAMWLAVGDAAAMGEVGR